MKRTSHIILSVCVFVCFLATGLGCSESSDDNPACTENADCAAGLVCFSEVCIAVMGETSNGTTATSNGTSDTGTCDSISAEMCDNTDNDCDGEVDENLSEPCDSVCGGGVRTCLSGTFGACSAREPSEERCNNRDDDCDNIIDEDFGLDMGCMVGTGGCAMPGSPQCTAEGDVVCEGEEGPPGVEVCDGIDNDCNGLIDDPFGGGAPCVVGRGACQNTGVTLCRLDMDGEVTLFCSETPGTADDDETCGDEIDNDCNGQVDDGC